MRGNTANRPGAARAFRPGVRTAWAILLAAAVAALAFLPITAVAADATYIGVEACGKCHKKKKEGEQLKIWQQSDHAKAFDTLAGDKAKEKAAKMGISGSPQKAEACLICHTTGFGAPAASFGKRFKMEEGVQCESCHGPGSLYRKKKTMKAISEERGPDKKGVSATAKKTGLVIPDEKVCQSCHVKEITRNGKVYKNPSFEPFDFKERHKKIKHPVPQ